MKQSAAWSGVVRRSLGTAGLRDADFLAGTAGEDWIPLRTREYYESIKVDLVTGDPAVRISPARHEVSLRSGRTLSYGTLLLATGAEPRSLPIEGSICRMFSGLELWPTAKRLSPKHKEPESAR